MYPTVSSMKSPYTVAISSFAVHGVASLKAFISVLGERILPVPSLLLNGLTNLAQVRKFDPPFEELLTTAFDLVVSREIEVILYIGYLGHAAQVDIILNVIEKYRANIKRIITDPVCGDHGRLYVSKEIIESWPQLIRKSNIVFPNLTELKLLTGHDGEDKQPVSIYISEFKSLFPETKLVVTSVENSKAEARGSRIGVEYHGGHQFSYFHTKLSRSYSGSGDVFLAHYILTHYYSHVPIHEALKMAADITYRIIEKSIGQGSDDLLV